MSISDKLQSLCAQSITFFSKKYKFANKEKNSNSSKMTTYAIIKQAFYMPSENSDTENEEDSPIAIIWGIDKTMRDRIASHFPSQRTAFSYPKTNFCKQEACLSKLDPTSMQFYFSSSFSSASVVEYAEKHRIPIKFLPQDNLLAEFQQGQDLSKTFFNGLFTPLGKHWTGDTPNKEVVIVIGDNPALFSRLNDYSMLHISRINLLGYVHQQAFKNAIDAFDIQTIFAWDDCAELLDLIEKKNITLFSIREGFLRALEVEGKNSGIKTTFTMFSCHGKGAESRSENACFVEILNNADFETHSEELQAVRPLVEIMKHLEISYNNFPISIEAEDTNPFFNSHGYRTRIAVIGDDTEPQEGMPTNMDMLRIAASEHPNRPIFYLPSSSEWDLNSCSSEEYAPFTIVEPGLTSRLLDAVSHVYVRSSLIGLEALWHGCAVSVFGTPFYAGWGLSDDRTKVDGRSRTLTLEELFYGTYFLCQSPVSDATGEPISNYLAVLFQLYIEKLNWAESQLTNANIIKIAPRIAFTRYWPILLRADVLQALKAKNPKINFMTLLPVYEFFPRLSGQMAQTVMTFFLVGIARKHGFFRSLLPALKRVVSPEIYDHLFDYLEDIMPEAELLEHRSWRCSKREHISEVLKAVKKGNSATASSSQDEEDSSGGTHEESPASTKFFHSPYLAFVTTQSEIELRNFVDAWDTLLKLLLDNFVPPAVFYRLANIASLQFDFKSAEEIYNIAYFQNINLRSAKMRKERAMDALFLKNIKNSIEKIVEFSSVNASLIGNPDMLGVLAKELGQLPYTQALFALWKNNNKPGPLGLASVLVYPIGDFTQAEKILASYTPLPQERATYITTLARLAGFQWDIEREKRILTEAIRSYPNADAYYHEAGLVIASSNDLEWARSFVADIESTHKQMVSPWRYKTVKWLLEEYTEGDTIWKNIDFSGNELFARYFPDKYITDFEEAVARKYKNILIFKPWGPGDEMGLSVMYPVIAGALASLGISCSFICDARLLSLFSRSYPEVSFVPFIGKRNIYINEDFSKFKNLPGSDLCEYFDNVTYDVLKNSDGLMYLWNAITDAEQITKTNRFDNRERPYLKADPVRVEKWQKRLSAYKPKPLVGLSWRSSLQHGLWRRQSMLSAEDIAPLLAYDEAVFINLQYDECSAELRYLNAHFPNRLINFSDVDQYNDFEEVAAIMQCLDLVIAPGTSVSALSSGLGIPTICHLVTHGYLVTDATDRLCSRWCHSLQYIVPEKIGDIPNLVDKLKNTLETFLTEHTKKEKI